MTAPISLVILTPVFPSANMVCLRHIPGHPLEPVSESQHVTDKQMARALCTSRFIAGGTDSVRHSRAYTAPAGSDVNSINGPLTFLLLPMNFDSSQTDIAPLDLLSRILLSRTA
ncbi:hypothetical protein AcW1_009295 [Taiwanofungus camphoratus]|nr:hypothetical protein AcW1_009295 [Antrodia cinnamomea]